MSEVIDTSKNPSALQLAQREIEQLKKRIRWLESGSIHTCHAECEKPLCVANREIERLRAIVLKIDTKDAMSVQDMYFISGAEQTITTLEAQIKELDEQNTQHKNNYELAYSLIKHISDRDLWQFKLPGSRYVHKALVSYPMDFELWDTFDVEKLIDQGEVLQRMYTQLVNNIVEGSFIGEIGSWQVPMVNTSIAWSEVGEAMYTKYPKFAFVASFTYYDNNIMFSLRSKGDFDVSEIAKQFGGGGHKNAAGFKVTSNDRIRFITTTT